jgi:Colicin V production protein.
VTYYDLIVVVLVALLAYRGFRICLVGTLLAWLAFGVGLLLAFRFDGFVGGWLAHIHALAPSSWRIVAFIAILGVVEIGAGWLARVLGRTLGHLPILGRLNRLGGVVLGALLALIPVWLVTAALLLVPHSLLSFSGTVSRSETAHLLRTLTPRWGARPAGLRQPLHRRTLRPQTHAGAPTAERWAGAQVAPAVVRALASGRQDASLAAGKGAGASGSRR